MNLKKNSHNSDYSVYVIFFGIRKVLFASKNNNSQLFKRNLIFLLLDEFVFNVPYFGIL